MKVVAHVDSFGSTFRASGISVMTIPPLEARLATKAGIVRFVLTDSVSAHLPILLSNRLEYLLPQLSGSFFFCISIS
jgi:hypothetical protein